MTAYEKTALAEIARWKDPKSSLISSFLGRLNRPMDMATGWMMHSPVGEAANTALTGVLDVINHGAVKTLDAASVYAKFNQDGHPGVRSANDIFTLDLASVDQVVGSLNTRYVVAGLVEGAATGIGGGIGLVSDIPLILALNLRAIADYALHYGRDSQLEGERIYALSVLDFSLSPTFETKRTALTQIAGIEAALGAKDSAAMLRKLGGTRGLKTLTDSIAHRMAKAKMAQMIPVAGAIVGGGFNAWLTQQSCDAAYHLYRGRFLDQRFPA
jgi:hypothetical protein